jgi:hypothetical protein
MLKMGKMMVKNMVKKGCNSTLTFSKEMEEFGVEMRKFQPVS